MISMVDGFGLWPADRGGDKGVRQVVAEIDWSRRGEGLAISCCGFG